MTPEVGARARAIRRAERRVRIAPAVLRRRIPGRAIELFGVRARRRRPAVGGLNAAHRGRAARCRVGVGLRAAARRRCRRAAATVRNEWRCGRRVGVPPGGARKRRRTAGIHSRARRPAAARARTAAVSRVRLVDGDAAARLSRRGAHADDRVEQCVSPTGLHHISLLSHDASGNPAFHRPIEATVLDLPHGASPSCVSSFFIFQPPSPSAITVTFVKPCAWRAVASMPDSALGQEQ